MKTTTSSRPFDAFILDCDGIALETETLHYEARRLALAGLGIRLTREDYRDKCMSRGHREQFSAVCPPHIVPPESYDALYRGGVQPLYYLLRDARLAPVPGFIKFFDRIRAHSYKIAVASTQPRYSVMDGLRRVLGDERMVEIAAIVSGEDVRSNKPSPDVFEKAAELISVPAVRCKAVEDSPVGVCAAKNAGMYCIARLSEWSTTRALKEAGADLVVQDFAEIGL